MVIKLGIAKEHQSLSVAKVIKNISFKNYWNRGKETSV